MDNELQDKMLNAILDIQETLVRHEEKLNRLDSIENTVNAAFGKMDEFLGQMKRNDEEIVALRATTDRHEEELVALKETIGG